MRKLIATSILLLALQGCLNDDQNSKNHNQITSIEDQREERIKQAKRIRENTIAKKRDDYKNPRKISVKPGQNQVDIQREIIAEKRKMMRK